MGPHARVWGTQRRGLDSLCHLLHTIPVLDAAPDKVCNIVSATHQ